MRDIVLLLASLAGAAVLTAAAVLIQPASPLWRWLLAAGAAVFIACALVLLVDLAKPGSSRFLLSGIGIGFAVFSLFCMAVYFDFPAPWQPSAKEVPGQGQKTLRQIFDSDFQNVLKMSRDNNIDITRAGERHQVVVRVTIYYDHASGSKFYGFYLPFLAEDAEIAKWLSSNYQDVITGIEKDVSSAGSYSQEMTESDKLKFTGKIYIYHEMPFTMDQADEIRGLFKQNNANVVLRGPDWKF